jgi:hypothetical protein
VICAYWQDDRYTDKSSLLNDARENLAKIAVPERSYDCAIVDLQATNPELYNNLDFSLFTVATLIDDVKETAIDYQVIERHVWPYHPDHNDVIFNSAPVKIQNSVIQIEEEINNPQSTFQQILNARIEMVTDWLTNSNSHVYIVEDDNGGIKEFLFVNGSQPIETATQVMRLNASGLGFSKNGVNGPFTNAFVFDSVLGGRLIADFITAGHMVADRIQGGTLESINSTTISGVTYKNFSLNMTTGAIEALKLSIKSANCTLTEDGTLTVANANISGTITGSTISGSTIESTHGGPFDSDWHEITITSGLISLLAYGNTGYIENISYNPFFQDYGIGLYEGSFEFQNIHITGVFANEGDRTARLIGDSNEDSGTIILQAHELYVNDNSPGGQQRQGVTGTQNGIEFVNGIAVNFT